MVGEHKRTQKVVVLTTADVSGRLVRHGVTYTTTRVEEMAA